ncbi:MAG TPA: C1 family peptidase [Terriglobales bacterium]|nr:C1 family peptidase [Terriglobales bacterium]
MWVSIVLLLVTNVACSQSQQGATAEHHYAKGGRLERPSKERVQKFAAAAKRALEQYQLKYNLHAPEAEEPAAAPSSTATSSPKRGAAVPHKAAAVTDTVFSWRRVISFNTNENQLQCGSCYIFAGVGALEENWAIQHPNQSIVDSQQLVLNCVGTCSGGYVSTVMDFLTGKGTSKGTSDGYTGIPSNCSFNLPLPYQGVAAAYVASDGGMPTESDLKAAILKYGPIAAFIYAGETFDSWWNQKEPAVISDDSSGDDNGHLILITGWNDAGNINAWEIKNSWGSTWGDDGFAYVRKGIRDLGDNAMWIIAVP